MKKVSKSSNIISSPAASFDRIEIRYGKFNELIISPKHKTKFVEDLQKTHGLFKHWVKQQRPNLDIDLVANGDVWYGQQAIDLGLVDEVGTSDEVLQEAVKQSDVLLIEYVAKKTIGEKFGIAAATSLSLLGNRLLSIAQRHSIGR